jgi:hypothetical protein
MTFPRFCSIVRPSLLAFLLFFMLSIAHGQGAKQSSHGNPSADPDHVEQRGEWFLRGRVIPGKSAAELRHRAYQSKMQARIAGRPRADSVHPNSPSPPSSAGGWTALGPVPLASDGSGTGFQDYHQVSGRATAVAIDPADSSGNTVFIGGAQGGVWKSTNAATSIANNVTWAPLTDDQATLSIGAIAIQAGNSDPTKSVILAGTGEADNAADSYFGLGILRSADGGDTWALIHNANSGTFCALSLRARQPPAIVQLPWSCKLPPQQVWRTFLHSSGNQFFMPCGCCCQVFFWYRLVSNGVGSQAWRPLSCSCC